MAKIDKSLAAKRSRSRKGIKVIRGELEFPSAAIARLLPNISHEKFVANSPVPPVPCDTSCELKVECQRDPVYVAGRYCKYDRETSQSQWIIGTGDDAERKGGGSTDEYISGIVSELFGPKESKFMAAGREDIDVRMLGEGRPFVIELLHAKRISVDQAMLDAAQTRINEAAGGMVECFKLRNVDKAFCEVILQPNI